MHNYYRILEIAPTASYPEIKLAYHSLLLKHHPDKNTLSKHNSNTRIGVDIGLIKEAYTILSTPLSRAQYDALLDKCRQDAKSFTPRPAEVISLEEFTLLDLGRSDDTWEYPCRCGGSYCISEADMENGQHLVECRSCSEVIWVGYEVQEDEDDR